MKYPITTLPLLLLCMLGVSPAANAQATYAVAGDRDVNVRLLGTSTVHDWEMKASSVTGEAEFVFSPGNAQELTALPALTFSLAVKDLRSESNSMDNNAYDALRAEEYERIDYLLASAAVSPETGGFLLKTKGKLTIAGTTRDIVMDVHLSVDQDGTVTCRGSYDLKMTDYGVDPPTFLLGVMKCGDDLTLEFSVDYRKNAGV
ncbi:YceI family protein [Lewinella sp. IMCC34191]|uniref:YceI family protein n=1 Tax=Lewinella sp. IMCC34191 TaxID=2259172 RepID=UPI000E235BF6|nr:YceI family protein [Lewinella sp. IMCC34191]